MKEYRKVNGELQPHSFNINDAIKFGVHKATILYNLRHWLTKNRADKTNIHKHTDGKEYYWTYNSGESYAELFPYFSRDKISRYLRELEEDGALISGSFNKMRYDRTKWYTIPNLYAVKKND